MQSLQRAIEVELAKLPEKALAEILVSKLKAQGHTLSSRELQRLVSRILAGETGAITLRSWQFWKGPGNVVIEFTPEDSKRLEELGSHFDQVIGDVFEGASAKLAIDTLKTLKRRWPRQLRMESRNIKGFRRRLYKRWGPAIERLRMLLVICREFGQSIAEDIHKTDMEPLKYRADVLTRLHARACQVTDEVICLLSAGFADGAMARWRTLNEIAIVALFVRAHGEDIAERYVAHQHVESWKMLQRYQQCYERLGYEPPTAEELQEVKAKRDSLVDHYGKTFGGDYGWAAHALGGQEPKLETIEASVGLDHWRAHYRMAGHNVHANPKGAYFKMGLHEGADLLLAGPSNFGLADPGHSAAISLSQISTTLFDLQPTFDNLVAMRVMLELVEEVGQAFIAAHEKLVEDGSTGEPL